MKRVLSAVLAMSLLCMVSPAFSQTPEAPGVLSGNGFTATGDVSFFTKYVWRGMILDRDAVIQPGYYLSTPDKGFGVFTAKIWVNHDLENEDTLKSDEQDYTLDYTYALGKYALSAGNTYYDFSGTNTFSKEWYLGLTFPVVPCPTIGTIKGITACPSVFFYRDYGDPKNGGGNGTYTVLNLGIGVPVAVSRYNCSLDLAGHYGFNHKDFINRDGQDLGLSAGFTVPITASATVSPNVNYSRAFSHLRDPADGNQKSRVYWGVTAKYKF
ncbi:MAG: hypothetical protein ACM3OC_07930 [Deltaproteobacteria bacterium]